MKAFLKKHVKLTVFCVIVLILAIGFAVISSRVAAAQEALLAAMQQPETALVEKRSLVESVSATGKIVSVGSKSIVADVTGVEVEAVNVKIGDTVAEGDVICMLDSSELETDLADVQASLAVTAEKKQIEVTASERSLQEAESTRNIDLERANQDVADAWNDYLMALTDLEEAEADYLEAQQTTIEKNGEYEYRQELLDEAEDDMEDAESGTGMSSKYETEFATEKSALVNYISTNGISCIDGALDKVYLSSADLPAMSISGIVTNPAGLPSEQQTAIEGYLGTLKGLQTKYMESSKADASYQEAQADYQSLQTEVTSWQSKYNTAKQNEEALKTAYDSAVDAAQAKLDAYNQEVRNQEDAVRNNESTVQTKEDSVSTSQLDASVVGLSDKQQIRQYQKQIEECTVTAPVSGVITELNIEQGDNYTGTAIATIEDISGYEIEAEIDEYDIGKIEVGQKVIIKTNGTGDEEMEGSVTEIAPRATEGASEVTYKVTISMDTRREELKMDMTARLSIILESKENVLTVPYDAVQEAEDGSFYVEVIDEAADPGAAAGEQNAAAGEQNAAAGEQAAAEQNAAADPAANMPAAGASSLATRQITVQKGIESDYYIEVISKELQEGMEVVVPKSEGDTGIEEMMMQVGPMGGM